MRVSRARSLALRSEHVSAVTGAIRSVSPPFSKANKAVTPKRWALGRLDSHEGPPRFFWKQ